MRTWVLRVVACLAAWPLPAQVDRAALAGAVTDVTGGAMAGIDVEVLSTQTGLKRQTKTDDHGAYHVSGLPIGRYRVTFSQPNVKVLLVELRFKSVTYDHVDLSVGQTRNLDAQMEFGTPVIELEVSEAAVVLERYSAELGTVIHSQQLQSMPLNGRHWASLMALAPGAINTGEGNQQSIRFVGRARDDNNWTFDSVDATGVRTPRQRADLRLIISTDSVAEFRVNSALYGADSGTAAGGQVNLVSKSGTKEWHGSLFEFLRNDRLDARGPFDSPKPPFRLNQFGGNLGGPLAKHRTFFFANYEGLRQRLGQTFIAFVPSAAFRRGAVSTSPAIRPILDAYPQGSAPTGDANIDEVSVQARQLWREDSGLLRLDHRLDDATSMFVRYSIDDGSIHQPEDAGLTTEVSEFRPSNLVIQLQRVISPSALNEIRLAMNRSALHEADQGPLAEQVEVPDFVTLDDSRRTVEAGTSYSLLDNFSMTRGRHSLKLGVEIRRIHYNIGRSPGASISFASQDDFIRNRVDTVVLNGELPTRGTRRTYYLGFVQDELRFGPTFTASLGLRYEYYTVMREILDRAQVFDLERCRGYCQPGAPFYFPDRNNFDPRVALVWSPELFRGKTVLRAGFGVYHGTGQHDDLIEAVDSDATRVSLSAREAPDLSFPVDRFLAQAHSVGVAPSSLQRDRRDLYSQQWGLFVQQQLPSSFRSQLGYTGSSAHKLFSRTYVNVIDPATGRRPLAAFGRVQAKENAGNSSFHALQFSLQRSPAKGWLWETQYMWSHSINDSSVGGGEAEEPQNVACRSCERASSEFDVRHTLTINTIFQLPIGPGRRFWRAGGIAGKLVQDWELGGMAIARTGRPVTVRVSRASSDLPDGNSSRQRPNVVSGVPLTPPGGRTPDLWINPAAFTAPLPGAWGNAGRNLVRGPGVWQVDLGLTKRNRINDRVTLDFRAEAFNLFNRAQLGRPLANISSPASFGAIRSSLNRDATGAGTSRQVQFMLRLGF